MDLKFYDLPHLYMFLWVMAGFIPIFVLMLFYYKKYANKNSSIITPLKVVAAVLLVLLAIKQIFNAVLGNFTKGYLPLHLSDFFISIIFFH